MSPILHIASKDLLQFLRDRKTFMFLLIMPIAFTLMFSFAFGGSNQANQDSRLPVGFLNQDSSASLSLELERLLAPSTVIRLENDPAKTVADLEKSVAEKKLAAAVIIPLGYGESLKGSAPLKLILLADTSTNAGLSAQSEILAAAGRLASAIHTAQAIAPKGDAVAFESTLNDALAAWQNPPVRLSIAQTAAPAVTEEKPSNPMGGASHSSPGMILQFAIAGLLTCAQVIVSERKSRCLQRMLTTATNRVQILLGHYLAIFALILTQFAILIVFGQLALQVNYFSQPLATLLIAVTAAACIAAMGLLVGALAKAEDQAITFSLIAMFLFSGLGGAWVPLEVTGSTFQAIGHLTPIAWAMDGFKNVVVRGLDVSAALLPAAALLGYALLFFSLASWRFRFE